MNHRENIEIYAVILQQMDTPDDPVKGSAPVASHVAESVMDFSGAVQRYAHQKMMLPEKSAPILIDENPVGLKGVLYLQSLFVILSLIFHDPAKEIQSPQRRLASLESIADHPLRAQHGLPYHIL